VRRLADAAPWYESEVLVVLAGAAQRLGDAAAMRTLLADAARGARSLPEAVVLHGWIQQSAAAATALADSVTGPASLTTAELRVLQLLPTHLSFREMAHGLHVSANTVKTHAHAVYRKLDASSRSEAVVRAREAGLLGDPADEFPARGEPWAAASAPLQPDALTISELRVIHLLGSELSFAEIGSRLGLSAKTVRTHAEASYRKLAACSRSEAVERARTVGLLSR
jgi:ATP/maltotriose-dependent transcriptional regulator MalT